MPSDHAAPSTRAALGIDRGLVLRYALGAAVVSTVIAAAVWPRRQFLGLQRLTSPHIHAPDWSLVAAAPPAVRWHLAAIGIALAVGIVLFVGVKGRTVHRVLGWSWVLAMMTAVLSSFFIRIVNHGQFSFIHLLSGWTIVALPMGVAFARRHKVRLHARMMTGIFTGGLALAGLLAFMPGRLMWNIFF
jgi:uncharacterized membrane protein